MGGSSTWVAGVAFLVVGCGGSCPPAADASSEAPSADPPALEEGGNEPGGGSDEESADSPPAKLATSESSGDSEKSAGASEGGGAEPSFPEGASVAQAVGAVPQGAQRSNIDTETLGEPLQNAALYEPCKVGAQHFKLKVAVWNGKAVGVDVATPNKALAACIDKQIRGVQWRDKVRSLNTVEYSM